MLRFLILLGAAIAILILGTALTFMISRLRRGSQQRARRDAASRRRVANAIDRADMATGTLAVPDRFGAIGVSGSVELTAEPRPGDLSTSVVSPSPPFDLTGPGAGEALQDWETATVARRRTIMIRAYLAHPLPRVRAEALELVGTLGSEDTRLADHLAVLLRDDAESVRRKAAAKTWEQRGLIDAVIGVLRDDADADGAARARQELVLGAPGGRNVPELG